MVGPKMRPKEAEDWRVPKTEPYLFSGMELVVRDWMEGLARELPRTIRVLAK